MAVRYYASFTSNAGIAYRADIHDSNYSGSPTDLGELGAGGFQLEYPGNDDERFDPIKASALNLFLMVEDSGAETLLTDIANGAERRFSLVVYKDGRLDWAGHIAPDLVELPDMAYPYVCRLTANDYLGSLSMPWEQLTGALGWKSMTFQEILLDLLSYTELDQFWSVDDTWLKSSINWYASTMPEWDTAEAYKARVIADGGTVVGYSILRTSITAARAVLLPGTSCYLLQYRDRVEADGGTVVNLFGPLEDNSDSVLLTAGTYGLDGYNPWQQVNVNVWSLAEGFGEQAKDELEISVYDALSQILRRFGARIYMSDGAWCVDQINNFSEATTLSRWYYKSGDEQFGIWQESRSVSSTGLQNMRESGGVYRFFRPLKTVEVEYRYRGDLNLATIRNASLVEVVTSPAGDGYSFGVVVDITTRRLVPRNLYFRLWFRVLLSVEDETTTYRYNNGDPDSGGTGGRYNWVPTGAEWSTTGDLYYNVMVDSYRQQGVNDVPVQIQIQTPEIPVAGLIRFEVEYVGAIYPSNPLDPDVPADFEIKINSESLVLLKDGIVIEDGVVNSVDSDIAGEGILRIEGLRSGDGPLVLSPGALLIEDDSFLYPLLAGGWRVNRLAEAVDIGELLAQEIMVGQQFAARRMDGSFIMPGYSLRSRVVRGNKAYIFSGVTLTAEMDTWSGTWFEVDQVTAGITPRVKSKIRDIPYLPQLPDRPAGDLYQQNSAGVQLSNKIIAQQQITTISADIAAGDITSVPIVAIGEAFLQAGDKIALVLLEEGIFYEATIATTPTAGATAIAINSLTVPFIGAGSPIIMSGRRAVRNIKIKDSGFIAGLAVAATYIGAGTDKVRINTADGDVVADRDIKAVAAVKVGAVGSEKIVLNGSTGAMSAEGDISTDADVLVDKNLKVKERVEFIGLPTTEPSTTGEIWVRTITVGEDEIKVLTIKE